MSLESAKLTRLGQEKKTLQEAISVAKLSAETTVKAYESRIAEIEAQEKDLQPVSGKKADKSA